MQRLTRPDLPQIATRLRAAGCVFAEDEARLLDEAAGDAATLISLVERRAAGEPLEPLLGWVDFAGLRLRVGPGVFIPRQRTAVLAVEAARIAGSMRAPVVVDLCCGVGAIAAVVGATATPGRLVAADLDPVAVELAAQNLARFGGETCAGDLYDALPPELLGAIDVLAVNAPYVPSAEIAAMPREARDHEPRHALDGGADGLDLHRRVAGSVRDWLAPAGQVLIESSRVQADRTAGLLAAGGLATRVVTDDELAATVVIGVAPR
jgi:release factor glutamine methyltransferase